MVRAILFDLDGTLLNRDESLLCFAKDQYERWAPVWGSVSKQEFVETFVQLDCRGYVWKDEVYKQIISKFGLSVGWEELLDDYITNFHHHCVPFPNMLTTLEKLKEYKLGLITNGRTDLQSSNSRALGLDRFMDTILISESEGVSKPDKEIFHRAAQRLGVTPEQCVFVGDHPQKDVAAAEKAGMTAVWKKDAGYTAPKTNYIVEDLEDLVSILKRINQYQS